MSTVALNPEPLTETRAALDRLANMQVDELRRLALQLEEESRIVKSLLRDRTRRPAARLSLLGTETVS